MLDAVDVGGVEARNGDRVAARSVHDDDGLGPGSPSPDGDVGAVRRELRVPPLHAVRAGELSAIGPIGTDGHDVLGGLGVRCDRAEGEHSFTANGDGSLTAEEAGAHDGDADRKRDDEQRDEQQPGRTAATVRRAGRVMTAMGSHLSGKVQAGRCRVRAACREDVVAIAGRARPGEVGETGREAASECDRRASCVSPLGHRGRRVAVLGSGGDAHRRESPVEAGLRRPERDAERVGRLGQRQLQVVAEDDDRALLRVEPTQRAVEEVTIGDERGRIGDRRGRRAVSAPPR